MLKVLLHVQLLGGTTGSNSHQHCSTNHTHDCETIFHSHTTGGEGTSTNVSGAPRNCGGFGQSDVALAHSHALTSPSFNATRLENLSCVSHTHATIDNKPPRVEVAFIKRI